MQGSAASLLDGNHGSRTEDALRVCALAGRDARAGEEAAGAEVSEGDKKWATYWALCKLGDYAAAVEEARRVAPTDSPWLRGIDRDAYIANMVRNHIEQSARERRAPS